MGVIGALLTAALMVACAGPPPKPQGSSAVKSGSYSSTPDGYYRVRRGDSLHAIAFKFGLDWREIARLNGISDPWIIYPDQLLRLTASATPEAKAEPASAGGSSSSSVSIAAAPLPSSTTSSMPEPPRSVTRPPDPDTPSTDMARSQEPVTTQPAAGTQAPTGTTYKVPPGDPARWLWPTQGRLISGFRANDPARKGIDIGGTEGQPVIASAPGLVVYSGSGLIGYGELIIIKHSDRMLSAYAHNSKRLVSEGQQVPAGVQIAEMGTNDRSQSVLHFEIRVNGSPEDPLKYLPQR